MWLSLIKLPGGGGGGHTIMKYAINVFNYNADCIFLAITMINCSALVKFPMSISLYPKAGALETSLSDMGVGCHLPVGEVPRSTWKMGQRMATLQHRRRSCNAGEKLKLCPFSLKRSPCWGILWKMIRSIIYCYKKEEWTNTILEYHDPAHHRQGKNSTEIRQSVIYTISNV